MDYYRNVITQKSWNLLTDLAKTHDFVLIGGWAVWLYTKQLKSKDIDMIVEFPVLEALRQNYHCTKNDRMNKYEIIHGEVHVDIYVPHWSAIGIPCETLIRTAKPRGGFRVPDAEQLVMLKQIAYRERAGSVKGRKDLVDVVSLISLKEFDWTLYRRQTTSADPRLVPTLKTLISSQVEIPELGLNRHAYARLKKRWLSNLGLAHRAGIMHHGRT